MATIVPLTKVADVLPGYAVKGKVEHDPEGEFQIVLPRHLGNDPLYRYTPADETLMTPMRSPARYTVHTGDVLFVSRGTNNRATYLEEVAPHSIATSVFYILRTKSGLEPRYLTWYLNQTKALTDIAQVRTGAGTPIVQRTALQELEIILPDLQTQKQIAALDEMMLNERHLRRKLLEQTENQHRLIGQQLLDKLLEDH